MRDLLAADFAAADSSQHRTLMATGDALLIEGTTWHDEIWGRCTCRAHAANPGLNHLGRELMALRDRLRGDVNRWRRVAVTGHRDLSTGDTDWVQGELPRVLAKLAAEHGTATMINGMAVGADTLAAQAALTAGLHLWSYIPYPQQVDRFAPQDLSAWQQLRDRAQREVMLPPDSGVRHLHNRNRLMMLDADAMIAIVDTRRTAGGPVTTVARADSGGWPVVKLDLATQRVTLLGRAMNTPSLVGPFGATKPASVEERTLFACQSAYSRQGGGGLQMKTWRMVAAGMCLTLGLAGCASTPAAAPVTSTVTAVSTAVSTAVRTVVSTVVTTLDPAAVSSSAAASKSSAAAAKALSVASVSSQSAAAAAAAGPIYYSLICSAGSESYVDFKTVEDARNATAVACSPGEKHGLILTATQTKALGTAYGAKPDAEKLGDLFAICADLDESNDIANLDGANEVAGALLICPKVPDAKKIQAKIDTVRSLIAASGDKNADVSDVVTYEITGSASTALVTYSQGSDGFSIGQENDVPVPWSKTLKITGEYRSLSVSAQNGGDGDITCTIKVGGNVVDTVTSKGAYAIASCSS